MADDREKNNQLVKAKTSSLQKRGSNIVSRGLSDLALLGVDSNVLNYVNKIKYSEDWDERQSAWLELRKMGPTYKGWVTSLVNLIYYSDGWGRIFAAESLSLFKEATNDAIPVLDALLEVSLSKEDTLWARVAAASLGKYDANSSEEIIHAIPTLIKALECSDYNVRGYAAKALANWGQLSNSAIVKLAELANIEDDPIFNLYLEALKQIIPSIKEKNSKDKKRALTQQAIGWFMKGVNYLKNKEYDKAIATFSSAFALGL
jgi:tetratricopeptide (TPR) repeat protein